MRKLEKVQQSEGPHMIVRARGRDYKHRNPNNYINHTTVANRYTTSLDEE